MRPFQSHKRIIGLEIATNKIRIAQIRMEKSPVVEKLAERETDLGGLLDAKGALLDRDGLRDVIAAIIAEHEIQGSRVHIGIPPRFVAVRQLSLPNVADRVLREVIKYELASSIHLPFPDPVFDFVHADNQPTSPHAVTAHEDVTSSEVSMTENQPDQSGTDEPTSHPNNQQSNAGQVSRKLSVLHQLQSGETVLDESGRPVSDIEALKLLMKQRPTDEPHRRMPTIAFKRHGTATRRQVENGSTKREVILVAAPRPLVDAYLAVASELKWNVQSVDIPALAIWRTLNHQLQVPGSAVVVRITPHELNIDLFYKGLLRLNRIVPMEISEFRGGGPGVLRESLELDLEVAAAAETYAGSPPRSSSVSASRQEQLNTEALGREISSEVNRTLHFVHYTLHHRDMDFTEIELVCSIDEGKDIAAEVERQTGIPVRCVSWRDLPIAKDADSGLLSSEEVQMGEFTATIGLALRAVKQK